MDQEAITRRQQGRRKAEPVAVVPAETPAPSRRGRKSINAVPADDTGAAKDGRRRRRASVGGMHLKLAVPQRAGYQRRWFNDVEGRIAEAHELAYDHVTDPDIKSDSPDKRVRRHVGTKANGQPLYAYLMETPFEEYRAGIDEREEQHRAVDQAINEGRDPTGRVQNTYGHSEIREG